MRQGTLIALALVVTASAHSQSRVNLAYVAPDLQIEGVTSPLSACVFVGGYDGSRFTPAPELAPPKPDFDRAFANSVRAFLPQQALAGVTTRGTPVRAVVEQTDPEALNELGAAGLTVRIQGARPSGDGVLLSTTAMPIRILSRQSARLDSPVGAVLRGRAQQLWNRHLQERSADERPARFTLKAPIVERVDSVPSILVVTFPMDIEEDNLNGDGKTYHDDRGQMFFIYSTSARRIIRAEFGHPEWSPGSTVRTIKPAMYFQVGSAGPVFFVGKNASGWEASEYGLFDLKTGRELLGCW